MWKQRTSTSASGRVHSQRQCSSGLLTRGFSNAVNGKPQQSATGLKPKVETQLPPAWSERIKIFEREKEAQLANQSPRRPRIRVSVDNRTYNAFADATPYAMMKSYNIGGDAVVCKIDGKISCLSTPLKSHCEIDFLSVNSYIGQRTLSNTGMLMVNQALEQQFPNILLYKGRTLDPRVTEDGNPGFLMDFLLYKSTNQSKSSLISDRLTNSDLQALQQKLERIIKQRQPIEQLSVKKSVALEIFRDNPLRTQLLQQRFSDHQLVSLYRCGPMIELSTGPHLPSTELIHSMKLSNHSQPIVLKTRGQSQQQYFELRRIFGVAFGNHTQRGAWEEHNMWDQGFDLLSLLTFPSYGPPPTPTPSPIPSPTPTTQAPPSVPSSEQLELEQPPLEPFQDQFETTEIGVPQKADTTVQDLAWVSYEEDLDPEVDHFDDSGLDFEMDLQDGAEIAQGAGEGVLSSVADAVGSSVP